MPDDNLTGGILIHCEAHAHPTIHIRVQNGNGEFFKCSEKLERSGRPCVATRELAEESSFSTRALGKHRPFYASSRFRARGGL